ncbi:MAG: hypothetical protein R6X12_05970 [bacterium]
MPDGTSANGDGLLTCPNCGHFDTVTVEYTCTACSHHHREPPNPAGHPVTRPCPDAGCNGTETGKVIHCEAC